LIALIINTHPLCVADRLNSAGPQRTAIVKKD